jgi:UDP-N-acetylglucosamine acyltransferase
MKIHPTAIIDPSATLHESVIVGPYSIIDADVRIGEGTVIDSSVHIFSGTTIGKNNHIFSGCCLGSIPQDLGYDPSTRTELIIGDNNQFREGVLISRGTKPESPTRIGDHNFMMGNFHLGHDSIMGNNCIMTQGAVVAGHVDIGNRVFISGLVAIHQFCRIGNYAMVAGLSKVTKGVPPFCTADGNPAQIIGQNTVGLRRAGMSSEVRNAIKEAYRIVYHSNLMTSQAIKKLKEMDSPMDEIKYIINFLESSDRGVTDHSRLLRE